MHPYIYLNDNKILDLWDKFLNIHFDIQTMLDHILKHIHDFYNLSYQLYNLNNIVHFPKNNH